MNRCYLDIRNHIIQKLCQNAFKGLEIFLMLWTVLFKINIFIKFLREFLMSSHTPLNSRTLRKGSKLGILSHSFSRPRLFF